MSEQSARGQFGIGEVLAQLQPEFPDISTSKIRFLEAEGLIEPARSRSGYRRFSAADIERLRYILTMQRDSYLPLRVIRERLADGGAEGTDGQSPAGRSPADMTRRQLLDAAEISEAELTELEDYGLIRRVGRQYGADALAVARALAALRQYGVQARHLRPVKAAADRAANLVEQVIAPQLRQRGPGARDAAASDASHASSTNANRAPQSASTNASSCGCSLVLTGTATSPAHQQANSASMYAGALRETSATRSPARRPDLASAVASRAARRPRSEYE